MAKFCTSCGAQADDNAVVCPQCGAAFPVAGVQQEQQPAPGAQPMPGAQQGQQIDKGMCILSYFGVLSFIPFFAKKQDQYIQFHAKQGVNLFILNFIVSFGLGFISGLLNLGFVEYIADLFSAFCVVLDIIGMVNACKGKMEPLPVVGGIKIVK